MRNRCLAVILLFTGVSSQAVLSGSIKLGIVQTVIENSLEKNCNKLLSFIDRAKAKKLGTPGCLDHILRSLR